MQRLEIQSSQFQDVGRPQKDFVFIHQELQENQNIASSVGYSNINALTKLDITIETLANLASVTTTNCFFMSK